MIKRKHKILIAVFVFILLIIPFPIGGKYVNILYSLERVEDVIEWDHNEDSIMFHPGWKVRILFFNFEFYKDEVRFAQR